MLTQAAIMIGIVLITIPLMSLSITVEPDADGKIPDSYWHSVLPFYAAGTGLFVANLSLIVWAALYGDEWYRRHHDAKDADRRSTSSGSGETRPG